MLIFVRRRAIRLTPTQFRSLARQIAGPHWKTHLRPMIVKCRNQIREYANGKRPVPETVAKPLALLTTEAGQVTHLTHRGIARNSVTPFAWGLWRDSPAPRRSIDQRQHRPADRIGQGW